MHMDVLPTAMKVVQASHQNKLGSQGGEGVKATLKRHDPDDQRTIKYFSVW
jgi:hypothetical protein